MSAATERVVALASGSTSGTPDPAPNVRVRRTRTRARPSVTDSDRASRLWVSFVARSKTAGTLVYDDARDSWIFNDRPPSMRDTWAVDYSDLIPGAYRPFALWCQVWRYPAAAAAAVLAAVTWLIVHPLRGPAALAVTATALTALYL